MLTPVLAKELNKSLLGAFDPGVAGVVPDFKCQRFCGLGSRGCHRSISFSKAWCQQVDQASGTNPTESPVVSFRWRMMSNSVIVIRGNRGAFDSADQVAFGHAPAGITGVELFFEVVNDFVQDIDVEAFGGLLDVNSKGEFHWLRWGKVVGSCGSWRIWFRCNGTSRQV